MKIFFYVIFTENMTKLDEAFIGWLYIHIITTVRAVVGTEGTHFYESAKLNIVLHTNSGCIVQWVRANADRKSLEMRPRSQ